MHQIWYCQYLGVAQKYLRTIETNYPSRFVLHSNDRSLKSPYWRAIRMVFGCPQCGIIRLDRPQIGGTIPHAIRPRCSPITLAKEEDRHARRIEGGAG